MKGLKHLLTILFLWQASFASAQDHVPGQAMVKLLPDYSIDEITVEANRILPGYGFHAEKALSKRLGIWLVSFDPEISTSEVAIRALKGIQGIDIAQLNHTNLTERAVPNDQAYSSQWSLPRIDAPEAWDIATGGVTAIGDTIVVAVIDGGFQISHEDLQPNIYFNKDEIRGNGIDDDGNGYIDDYKGWDFYSNDSTLPFDTHGNHVAGIIGAASNNGLGMAGINWDVKMMLLAGSSTLESTVVEAYSYVHDMRARYNESGGNEGAYVVVTNASFGVDNASPADYPIWCSMYDALGEEGVISTGATANNHVDVDQVGDIPTACPSDFLITVTSTTNTDQKSNLAGYGATTIDIGAPGEDVYSALLNNGYGIKDGTSMATPHVTGAIALMYAAICHARFDDFAGDPEGLAQWVRDNFMAEGFDPVASLNGITVTGGRLNLHSALLSVVDPICLSVDVSITESDCGACNGVLEAEGSGGVAPYTYQWSDPQNQTGPVATGLCPGFYSVTVTDADGNIEVGQISLSDVNAPVLTIDVINPSCPESSDGLAIASGAVSYVWFDQSEGSSHSGLPKGDYFVVGIDTLSNCSTTTHFSITGPLDFDVDEEVVSNTGGATPNGSVELDISGGTAPYSVQWSTGETGPLRSGLDNNVYHYSITDANGCAYSDSVRVGWPLGILNGQQMEEAKVYPNPSQSVVYISAPGNHVIEFVKIHSFDGKLIEARSFSDDPLVEMDVRGFSPGIYLMEIVLSSGKTTWSKFIRQEG